jgi:predicted metal-binding protein
MKVKKNLVNRLDVVKDLGASKVLKINPKDIIVAEWVRVKCVYGCPDYGESLSCPPFSPSLDFTRRFLDGYSLGLLIQFDVNIPDSDERREWGKKTNEKLLELERETFLRGHHKAFGFSSGCCKLCKECFLDEKKCPSPEKRRVSPESFGIDVFGTARKYGINLTVKKSEDEPYKCITFLLIK